MITKELIKKAKKCASKEELFELAKSENIELGDADLNNLLAFTGTNKELSDEELENVTGGTCYGDGWDGVNRPIVTHDNNCALFEMPAGMRMGADVICANCRYYSYRVNEERISLVSGWCTNDKRIEGKDIIQD